MSAVRRGAWWALGVVVLVVGVALLATRSTAPVAEIVDADATDGDWAMGSSLEITYDGWFASWAQVLGAGLLLLGLLVLVGRAAYLLGRRRRPV